MGVGSMQICYTVEIDGGIRTIVKTENLIFLEVTNLVGQRSALILSARRTHPSHKVSEDTEVLPASV